MEGETERGVVRRKPETAQMFAIRSPLSEAQDWLFSLLPVGTDLKAKRLPHLLPSIFLENW